MLGEDAIEPPSEPDELNDEDEIVDGTSAVMSAEDTEEVPSVFGALYIGEAPEIYGVEGPIVLVG